MDPRCYRCQTTDEAAFSPRSPTFCRACRHQKYVENRDTVLLKQREYQRRRWAEDPEFRQRSMAATEAWRQSHKRRWAEISRASYERHRSDPKKVARQRAKHRAYIDRLRQDPVRWQERLAQQAAYRARVRADPKRYARLLAQKRAYRERQRDAS